MHTRTPAILAAIAVWMLIPVLSFAQSTVTGTVVDAESNDTLQGVHIRVDGTTIGVVTDAQGAFRLTADRAITNLTVSYIGYRAQNIEVGDQTQLTIRLEPGSVDLQPVIVSAARGSQARKDAPVAIATLTAAKLEESKPTMLYQALNQIPGVHMTNLGSEQHTMSIRQPIQYKALFVYLEDGMPIRPTGIFNHNALIEINMASVGRVEVMRGPSSALYGSNAVGGAINFLTPEPTQEFTGYFNARMDNYGYRRSDFNASSTFGKLGVYGGGYVARQRDGWADHTDFDKFSLTLRADYTFSDQTRLSTTFTSNHLDADMTGSLDSTNFFGRGYSSLQTFTYRQVDATRIRTALTHDWNETNSTEVALSWRDNSVGQLPSYRVRNDRFNASRATGEINDNSFTSYVANVQHKTFLDFMQSALTVGVAGDLSPSTYDADFLEIQRDSDGRYISYTGMDSVLTDYDIDLINTAAYAQFEFTPVQNLRVVAALRYDRIDYDYDNHLPTNAFSGAPDETNSFNSTSPKLGFTYDFGRGKGVYANISRGFIPPEVGELYRGVKVPTLKPATFDSREIGGWAALVDGKVYADISLYQMDGTNEIITVQADDGSTVNQNAGETRHRGVELAGVFNPVRALTFRFGGTYAEHTFIKHQEGATVLDGKEMNGAPKWIVNAEVTYRPPMLAGSRVGLEWQHMDSYYLDTANTGKYGGYDLFFLRFGYELKGVELWANIENLTDELFANVAARSRFGDSYTPGAARNVVFGIGYNF